MKKAIAILAVLSFAAFAGEFAVCNSGPIETDADWLTYDDGTPHWYLTGGMYRGVWFNVEDFNTSMGQAEILKAEVWFCHGSTRPWDISDVYFEIWDGVPTGPSPTGRRDQTTITAVHNTAMYVDYASAPITTVANDFWTVINLEMSGAGYPSSYMDKGPNVGQTPHSFGSEDMIIWEPFIHPDDPLNFMMRVYADLIPMSFDNTSWGSIKAIF
ncbi:MAG: hypothetical protein KAR40_02950 [Candidatus Sabulitectum sp.]|nr:hypothetical protein [Candidatus Sabulitectum sp.]